MQHGQLSLLRRLLLWQTAARELVLGVLLLSMASCMLAVQEVLILQLLRAFSLFLQVLWLSLHRFVN